MSITRIVIAGLMFASAFRIQFASAIEPILAITKAEREAFKPLSGAEVWGSLGDHEGYNGDDRREFDPATGDVKLHVMKSHGDVYGYKKGEDERVMKAYALKRRLYHARIQAILYGEQNKLIASAPAKLTSDDENHDLITVKLADIDKALELAKFDKSAVVRIGFGLKGTLPYYEHNFGPAMFSRKWPAGEVRVLKDSPDGKLTLRAEHHVGDLIDRKSNKPTGLPLDHGHPITCWSFSPDGKRLAIGAGYEHKGGAGSVPTSMGRIRVWDVAAGDLLAIGSERLGRVNRVGFSQDGNTVYFEADNFNIDGP